MLNRRHKLMLRKRNSYVQIGRSNKAKSNEAPKYAKRGSIRGERPALSTHGNPLKNRLCDTEDKLTVELQTLMMTNACQKTKRAPNACSEGNGPLQHVYQVGSQLWRQFGE